MLSEEIRGIANEVERLENSLERVEGERVQFGDHAAQLLDENIRLNALLDVIDIKTKQIEKKLDLMLSLPKNKKDK